MNSIEHAHWESRVIAAYSDPAIPAVEPMAIVVIGWPGRDRSAIVEWLCGLLGERGAPAVVVDEDEIALLHPDAVDLEESLPVPEHVWRDAGYAASRMLDVAIGRRCNVVVQAPDDAAGVCARAKVAGYRTCIVGLMSAADIIEPGNEDPSAWELAGSLVQSGAIDRYLFINNAPAIEHDVSGENVDEQMLATLIDTTVWVAGPLSDVDEPATPVTEQPEVADTVQPAAPMEPQTPPAPKIVEVASPGRRIKLTLPTPPAPAVPAPASRPVPVPLPPSPPPAPAAPTERRINITAPSPAIREVHDRQVSPRGGRVPPSADAESGQLDSSPADNPDEGLVGNAAAGMSSGPAPSGGNPMLTGERDEERVAHRMAQIAKIRARADNR
ncbi:MAG: zeta toxin family protein [Phycisphaerales bacterium]|nr:zeta toxin family protein [Phycisphaerales bacterium]